MNHSGSIDVEWIERFMEMNWRIGDYKVFVNNKSEYINIIIYLPIIKSDFTAGMLMARTTVTFNAMKEDKAAVYWNNTWKRLLEILQREVLTNMGFYEEKKTLMKIMSTFDDPSLRETMNKAIHTAMMQLNEEQVKEVADSFFKYELTML